MGNEKSKKAGRGQALGSSNVTQGQRLGSNQNIDRKNLVHTKHKIGVSELQKKEKILSVLDQANARQQGDYDKIISAPVKQDLTKSDKVDISNSFNYTNTNKNNNNNNKNVYMASPYSKQAIAAEQRLKSKNTKTNKKGRKQKTINLVFGDGLKTKELTKDDIKRNNKKIKQDLKKKNININKNTTNNENGIIFNDTRAANAAMNRLYGNKKTGIKERQQRTMDLLHGDLLKDKCQIRKDNNDSDKNKNEPKYADMEPEVAIVHQALLNVVNSNSNQQMPATAKLLRNILKKIINAKNAIDQEKYGKLRMNQPKIKATLIDIQNGLELLESMGFAKKQMKSKEDKMQDYMVYDYSILSRNPLKHALNIINTYYPEKQK